MAVEQPRARVVSLEGNYKVTSSRYQCNVTSGWVVEFESDGVVWVIYLRRICALGKQGKVVPV